MGKQELKGVQVGEGGRGGVYTPNTGDGGSREREDCGKTRVACRDESALREGGSRGTRAVVRSATERDESKPGVVFPSFHGGRYRARFGRPRVAGTSPCTNLDAAC
ncbi:hypothetical protein BHE74_00045790 [Ensete ventricosum]|nr:hypothetical protein BHE74_00045790 [Ensete ventricosum]RZR83966.1 hypothetical protein BHM03_00010692 [Ensete ventricosum]